MGKLDGRICLVAGASRGVGRGIAEGLGEEGATVYVTGRTTGRRGRIRGRKRTAEGRPETIEETAERVTGLGGEGIAVPCDHTVEAKVVALVQRIERERGRLDVLANNVWGGYERHDEAAWEKPFWEIPIERWDLMMKTGLEGKWRTARLAAPLLIRSRSALLVNISSPVGTPYRSHLPYYVVNHAVDRMTEAMAGDLRRHGVVVVSLQPGFTRTERVEEVYAADPAARKKDRVDETAHSPRYVGRAVAALAAAPAMERSGQVWPVGVLARELGFTDVDGRQPMWPPAEAEAARRKPERKARPKREPSGAEAPARRGRGRKPGKEAAAAPARRARGKKPAKEAPAAGPAGPEAGKKPPRKRRSRGGKRKKVASGSGASKGEAAKGRAPRSGKSAPPAAASAKAPRRRSRGGRRKKGAEPEPAPESSAPTSPEATPGGGEETPKAGRRRRRGRRGGRGRKGPGAGTG